MSVTTLPKQPAPGLDLQPGSKEMPPWNVAELPECPPFRWRNLAAMIGPGLMMGGAAIGGGEWLVGPQLTARFGGSLLWLATLSILGQVIYNLEISRYTLYTGEPIFTGKFRTLPGPRFWVLVYFLLDIGMIFPYLASSAATPLLMIWLKRYPDTQSSVTTSLLGLALTDAQWLRVLGLLIFVLSMIPLIFGGKVYNSLKAVMTVKVFVVLGFLLLLGLGYSEPRTWADLASGFFKFGNLPIERNEDANGNGVLDPGEDYDGDGHLDVVEARVTLPKEGKDDNGRPIVWEKTEGGLRAMVRGEGDTLEPAALKDAPQVWPDQDNDGKPEKFVDVDGDGYRDGDNVENAFVSLWKGNGFPAMNLAVLGLLCSMVGISGQGGLSNTPVSNYTRDQGWGMGHHVGAIPSVVGGHHIELSHEGSVFKVDAQSLPRWKRWYRHVMRDQLLLWMPACFIGLALPSMLSAEFLRRGSDAEQWVAAGMTAQGVHDRIAEPEAFIGQAPDTGWRAVRNRVTRAIATPRVAGFFWFLTLACGLLTLAPTMSSSADGFIRRWVDVGWTALPALRKLDPGKIRVVYFSVLCGYVVLVLLAFTFADPGKLLRIATNIFNFALGFSCFHALAVNLVLLPKELQPNWFVRISMVLSGCFFLVVATLTAYVTFFR